MSPELLVPDQYPTWVPGRLTVRSPDGAWDGLTVRGFRYGALDVVLPPVRDFLIVAYREGAVDMRRTFDGRQSHEQLGPGDVSLLTRAVETHWQWREDIEVVHLHLTRELVASVCEQMYDREIEQVTLRDKLRADDPQIHRIALMMAAEAAGDAYGSRLLVESLSCQLAVHLLRRHADITFREYHPGGALSPAMLKQIDGYVRARLSESISLQELASAVALSRYHFARRFREATGTSPHEYVMGKRVEAAQTMLRRTRAPLREVAAACGFTDQSHLTRVFRQRLGVTPGQFRNGTAD